MMEGDRLAELAEDIKSNGLMEPIILHEGKILDGRNRYAACLAADVTPVMKKYTGKDPLAFVLSANLHRRHLNEGQRAMIAAKILEASLKACEEEINDGGFVERPSKEKLLEQAAEQMNISKDSVKKAKRVREGAPAKAKEVEAGEKTLHKAHTEMRKEDGEITPADEAEQYFSIAINALKKIPFIYRAGIYARVEKWMKGKEATRKPK